MKRLFAVSVILAATASGVCAQTNLPAALDIAEAVFRYQFEHNASGVKTNAAAYFISIKGQDLTDAFMKKFEGHQPPVKRASESASKSNGVVDPTTGMPAVVFGIEQIRLISPEEAIVEGGYFEGGLSSSGNTFTVRREKGKWIVTQDKMNWISDNRTEQGVPGYGPQAIAMQSPLHATIVYRIARGPSPEP